MIRPDKRLLAAASLVRGGETLIDIGTDHAYLPVYLVQRRLVPDAIASDVGEGPLLNAKKTVSEAALTDVIRLRLSDGLKEYRPYEANEIVICGMGGNLIEEILTDAPWVKNERMHLVLQPMTHSEDVRRYLCQNGFRIEKELCTEDGGRVYLTLSAVWTNEKACDEYGYYYFGTLLGADGTAKKYIDKQIGRVVKRLSSLKAVNRFPEEQALLEQVVAYYRRHLTNDSQPNL